MNQIVYKNTFSNKIIHFSVDGICLLFLMTLKEVFLNGYATFVLLFLIDRLIVYPTVKKIFNLHKKYP
jgi:hypothetical protein